MPPAATAARRPALYLDYGVPDTLQGRFEMVALALFPVLNRLMHEPGDDPELARLVSESFVDDMDAAFREMGVSDHGGAEAHEDALQLVCGTHHRLSRGARQIRAQRSWRRLRATSFRMRNRTGAPNVLAAYLTRRHGSRCGRGYCSAAARRHAISGSRCQREAEGSSR